MGQDGAKNVTFDDVLAGLRDVGIAPGSTVLVHSALRPFGRVDGGADTVAAALSAAVGAAGTLVAPAFTFRHEVAEDPLIDPGADRSEMGGISEAIRLLPGARRSTAYRHSFCAIGANAGAIVDVDPSLPVFDMSSSFGRMLALDTTIVMLGLTYVSCTSFHFGEFLVQIPDRHTVEHVVKVRGADGEVRETKLVDYQPRPTDDGREYEHEHDFDGIGARLEDAGLVRISRVGNAVIRAFSMRDLIHFILDRYGLEPDIFYLDPAVGRTELTDGVSVFTGELLDGAGRLVETYWSCVSAEGMHAAS